MLIIRIHSNSSGGTRITARVCICRDHQGQANPHASKGGVWRLGDLRLGCCRLLRKDTTVQYDVVAKNVTAPHVQH